ncbi:MAG: carboxypeptidase family protein, partial [Sphingomonadales bacterium]|nr:carboxypeptidase family protein [Sphingomonadales bacterium]
DARLNLWLTARQHPGETMAEWWMEGFLERLLDENDPVSRSLLSKARFFAIPNMNPDGSRRGHLRTNAAGANLNREWDKASMAHSPEVKLVLNEMDKRGVDFHFDIHGDEDLPYNFIAGFEGIPNITDHQLSLLERFKATYATISPDFQVEEGYPPSKPGEADLSMCTNQVANRFGCLAMTLEMPFKDNANLPDETAGWSPERSHNLGRAALDVIHALIDDLRP